MANIEGWILPVTVRIPPVFPIRERGVADTFWVQQGSVTSTIFVPTTDTIERTN